MLIWIGKEHHSLINHTIRFTTISQITDSIHYGTMQMSDTVVVMDLAAGNVDGILGGKRKKLTGDERLRRNRERNRMHARKTRERKKLQSQVLQTRINELHAGKGQCSSSTRFRIMVSMSHFSWLLLLGSLFLVLPLFVHRG